MVLGARPTATSRPSAKDQGRTKNQGRSTRDDLVSPSTPAALPPALAGLSGIAAAGRTAATGAAVRLNHGVIRRHREEVSARFRSNDVRHPVFDDARAWIGEARRDHQIQLRRVPLFLDDLNRAIITDATGRDHGRLASSCGLDTLNLPGAQRLLGRLEIWWNRRGLRCSACAELEGRNPG